MAAPGGRSGIEGHGDAPGARFPHVEAVPLSVAEFLPPRSVRRTHRRNAADVAFPAAVPPHSERHAPPRIAPSAATPAEPARAGNKSRRVASVSSDLTR